MRSRAPHRPGGWANVRYRRSSDGVDYEGVSVEDALRESLAIDLRETENLRQPFFPWATRIHEPKTGPLDFTRFPFQRELYTDEFAYDPEGVIKKATQGGLSAWLIRWTLFFPDTKGWTSLYVFPKAKQLNEFSDQRVKPLIERSEYLRERVPYGYVNNKGLKQVGLGFANYRGSQNKDELDSVDADVIGFDEYDRLVQENIPDAEQRITGSPHGLIRRVGVPTIPRRGIARLYDESDRRKWLVRCERCRIGWQEIDFWHNVAQDGDRVRIVCSGCRRPLDVREGEWVPGVTEVQRPRGYHVPRLIVPGTNLARIVLHSKQRKPYEITRFFNKDLGLEYANPEGSLNEAAIEAAQTAGGGYELPQGYRGERPVTCGIDMASTRAATVRISEHLDEETKRALWIGEVDGRNLREFIGRLSDLMTRYRVNMASIDHLPDGRVARTFANMFPGIVYVTALSGRQQKQILLVDDQLLQASVKRTEALDAMISMVREQKNHLPVTLPEGYVEQMCAPQRFEEEDEETGEVDVGYLSTGPDDYAMAEVYDMIATELWWMRQTVQGYFQKRTTTLEEHVPFERSDLDTYGEDSEFSLGPERDMTDTEEDWKPLDEEWPRY